MGQYYQPILSKKGFGQKEIMTAGATNFRWLYSHDYDNGLKLMEHSWVGNCFVGAVSNLLLNNPHFVVWAGDYADDEPFEIRIKIEEEVRTEVNLNTLCEDYNKIQPKELEYKAQLKFDAKNKFLINHTKSEYVDITKSIKGPKGAWNEDMQIHPLPLLTCEGNGRGGGDFRGEEKDLVGRWSRDLIEVSAKLPSADKEELVELIFDLTE